ncbi:MAG TPA: acetyl-CoA carboxylase carboxyl transferase subunit alpha, partial [Clostridia bacterium]|nr:acetyl-CoA carboxylase carboxyl transferase subunit alpha [Clostridia bacterium]
GGALALAVADEVWMLENAVYSVISPEGCASILWKDPKRVGDAAERLKLTARDLLALGVIERILPEAGFEQVYATLRQQLPETFRKLQALPERTLLAGRYQRFRKMGADALCMRS